MFEPKSSGLLPLEFPLKTSPELFPWSPELKESCASAAGIREAARMKFTNNKAKTSRFPLMMLLREQTRQLYVLPFLGTSGVRSKHQYIDWTTRKSPFE